MVLTLAAVPALAGAATASDAGGNLFQQIIDAAIPIGPYQLHWLELIGVLIGVGSAYLGMKRWVWSASSRLA